MNPENASRLFKLITDNPSIKRVLDLGTGIGLSSAIAALALKTSGREGCHIETVDQFDKCIRIAKNLIPVDLQAIINFNKAEAVTFESSLIPRQVFSVYDRLPEGEFDLIVNDGPSPFMQGEAYLDLPNGTVVDLLLSDKLKAGTLIAFDGRLTSLSLVERFFSDNFYLTKPSIGRGDFNVIERKDNPVLFVDQKLEGMKEMGYFNDEKENLHSDNSKTASSEATIAHSGA